MFSKAHFSALSCSCFLLVGACGDPAESGGDDELTGGSSATGGSHAPGAGGTGVPSATGGNGGSPAMSTGGVSGLPPDTGGVGGMQGTGGDSGSGGAPSTGTGGSSGGSLPPVSSVDEDGPYSVTIDENAGANSWVFRPTELGDGGVKHPIFVWGTGATSVPRQYTFHFNRVASHGFVVISPNSPSVTATLLKASLDWILAEDDKASSVYYQKLDTAKIAMGGHSRGSLGTFDAEATETRLTTTIHIAGGSFDGMGSSKVRTPTAYICGAAGDIALPQCQVDFQNVQSQPTFYSELQGIGHTDAARAAVPGMVAWLRWHLAGEVERKAMFTGPSGEFFTGIWRSQTKNW